MASTNDLVPASALTELTALDAALATSQTKMKAMLEDATTLKDALSNQAISYKDLTAAIKGYNELEGKAVKVIKDYNVAVEEKEKLMEKLLKETGSEAKALQELEKINQQRLKTEAASQKEERERLKTQKEALSLSKAETATLSEKEKAANRLTYARSNEGKETAALRLETQQLNQMQRTGIRESKAAEGSMDQMAAKLIRLRTEFRQLSVAQRESAIGKNLQKEITELNAELLKIEQSYGVHKRNVGNYASAFGDLGFSIQQVARELPTLSIGFSQFFLAISNNVPMLADQIRQARMEYDLLKNAGEKAVPVWKQVTSSIFSWQTALVAGVTLLTLYGKEIVEWIKGLLKGGKALDEMKMKQEGATKIAESSGKTLGEQIVILKKLQEGWTALANDLEAKKIFIIENKDEFQKLGVAVTKVNEVETMLVDSTPAFVESLKSRAKAAAAYKISQEKYAESMEDALKNQREIEEIQGKIDAMSESERNSNMTYYVPTVTGGLVKSDRGITYNEFYTKQIRKLVKETEDGFAEGNAYFNMAIQYRKEAEEQLENIGLVPDRSQAEGTREYWEKMQKDAKAAIDNMNADVDKGSEDWNKAVEKYNQATEKLKMWDLSEKGSGKGTDKAADEERKAAQELALYLINKESEKDKRIVENNRKSYDERIAALNAFAEKQRESVRKSAEFQLSDTSLTASQKKLIREKEAAELLKIQETEERMLLDITKDYVAQQKKIIERAAGESQDKLTQDEAAAIQELKNLYLSGAVTYEEYEKRKLDTINEYVVKRIDAEVNSYELLKDIAGLTAEEQEDFERNLQEARVKLIRQANDTIAKEYDKLVEEKKKKEDEAARDETRRLDERERKIKRSQERLMEYGIRLGEEMSNYIYQLIDARYERQLNALEKEADINDEWRDRKIKNIEEQEQAGVLSKENAEAQKAYIDVEAERREKELEQKRKEILYRQAKYEKAQSLLNISMNTAQAVTKQLAAAPFPFNLFLVAAVTAIGAAQFAAVSAKPLPEYEEGTGPDRHPGGPALVGEKRRELVILPTGHSFVTPARPTIYDLPKGTEVLPDLTTLYAKDAVRIPEEGRGPVVVQMDVTSIIRSQEEVKNALNSFRSEVGGNLRKIRANEAYRAKLNNAFNELRRRRN
jgi:hypothetical protein